jgi:Ca2+-binding EF-hand superfamily protein
MRIQALIAASAMVVCAAGFALPAQAGQGHFMRYFDSNNDGVVTPEEFNQASGERFTKMDANGDGKVTVEEFTNYVQTRRADHREKRFEGMDSDKNGSISKEEWLAAQQARAERKFQRMDKDSNGSISTEEYQSCNHKGKHKHGHKHKGGKFSARIFSHMDTNGDGVVTQDESHAAWTNWYKKLDANGDGTVTADEIAKARRY